MPDCATEGGDHLFLSPVAVEYQHLSPQRGTQFACLGFFVLFLRPVHCKKPYQDKKKEKKKRPTRSVGFFW